MQQNHFPTLPKLLISACLVLLILSCSGYKKLGNAGRYSFEIRFGSTGGVTNINPVFIITSAGVVSKQATASDVLQQIRMMRRQQLDSVYLLLDKSGFNSLKINEVSNFNQFIEVKSEKINNKISWYDPSQIPTEVNTLHTFLLTLIKK